jgi:yeast amino acid transporter
MARGVEKLYEETNDYGNNNYNSGPMYGTSFDGSVDPPSGTLIQRFVDSFKPAPHIKGSSSAATSSSSARVIPYTEHGNKAYDVDSAAAATAQSPLARKLKGRHLQMIAIGGSIGMLSEAKTTLTL